MEKIEQLKQKRFEIENEIKELNQKIRTDDNDRMKYVKSKRLFDLELKKNKKEIELEQVKKEIEIFKKP